MHARHNHDRMNPDNPLAEALRALPAQAPPHDAWPLLAARARRRRRLRLGVWAVLPATVAAAIVLAVLLPAQPVQRITPHDAPATVATAPDGANDNQVVALRKHSQRLQAWVRQLRTGAPPLNGRELAVAVDLQDGIALVDLQLGAAQATDTQSTLWRHRIVLLRQLALLRLGAGNDYTRVANNGAAEARHAIWIN